MLSIVRSARDLGSTRASRVLTGALAGQPNARPAIDRRRLRRNILFREGAEQHTRGACAPRSLLKRYGSSAEHANQVFDLSADVCWVCYGFAHRRAEHFGETFTQAMHGHFDCAFRRAELP